MTDAAERLSDAVCRQMAQDVDSAGGCEVLWCGKLDGEGMIYEAVPAARGHEQAVPAIFPHMEKGDVIIHNHPSGILKPSSADLTQASLLGNNGIGFYIVDNEVGSVYVVVEPVPVVPERPLAEEDLASILEPGGALSRISPGYEERPSQVGLVRLITRGFNEEKLVVAEAGTGVGKSYAYLLPSLCWAEANEQRVVISTATINLQQQIMEKDLPMARQLTGTDVKAVLVKGRRNYLCLNRLQEALEEDSLFRDENDELFRIREWAASSKEGSLSELPVVPDDALWSQLCSETDACFGPRCRYHERCFVMRARREAASAGILVVNHHLFFADLSLRLNGMGFDHAAVLPPYHKIVFDEAHNIENSATSFFSGEYSRKMLRKHLSRLYRQKRGRSTGILMRLEQLKAPPDDLLFTELIRELTSQAEITDALAFDYNPASMTIRITDVRDPEYRTRILEPVAQLRKKFHALLDGMVRWNDLLDDADREHPAAMEFKMILSRLNQISSFLDKFYHFDGDDDENIYWLEKRVSDRGAQVRFVVTPLDISSWMRSGIYDSYGTAVFTSATLTIDRQFRYWMGRVGMLGQDGERVLTGQFDSPFPYGTNVLLGLPENIPEPSSEAFGDFLVPALKEMLELNEGRSLVLFTSYDMLRRSYEQISAEWTMPEISLLRQGSDDRSRLLKRFSEDTASVLFATDSFWEGVDTPGESLRLVIICRLPFRVPSDPVYQARLEAIEKRGGNPFRDLSLPEAVMKFRQGFGRLMRRKSDRGGVVVLDPRLVTRNYGVMFLRSLPKTLISRKSFVSVLEDLENFIYL